MCYSVRRLAFQDRGINYTGNRKIWAKINQKNSAQNWRQPSGPEDVLPVDARRLGERRRTDNETDSCVKGH
jgi:hypothetical protein